MSISHLIDFWADSLIFTLHYVNFKFKFVLSSVPTFRNEVGSSCRILRCYWIEQIESLKIRKAVNLQCFETVSRFSSPTQLWHFAIIIIVELKILIFNIFNHWHLHIQLQVMQYYVKRRTLFPFFTVISFQTGYNKAVQQEID